ncbi:UPF0606 protein KIAA1549 [Alosa sapidissima]|uniref:UPF0606 protein KIAA1549 n=1 Tax=Alosa sapidissima TaxID=34773 RepID=UPI001C0989E3|nr:UPF0606 protein KIAA1549 [Alosa sapidissima]
MMESESSESLRSNPTLGRRVQGWCVLLLAAGMLVTMATWSTPVAVSSLSERGLPEPAARIASAANRTSLSLSSSSSSSSSSSWPQRFEAARRHSPPGSRHSKKASGHHGHGRGPVSSANANVSRARTEASDDRNDGSSREDGMRDDGSHDDGAQGIHLLLRPPELLAPSQGPLLHGNERQGPLLHGNEPTPATPTLAPPDDTESSPTAEDWGSGDYLETLTFMGADAEDLSLLSSLPTHTLTHSPMRTHTHTHAEDLDEAGTGVSYDTAFPARPTLPLSSRPLPPTAAAGDPRLPPGVDVDQELDFDWAELYPIEPTEMLLPDMNSLEYYNMLQNRENVTRTHTTHTHTHTPSKEAKDNSSAGQEQRDSKDTSLISPTPAHTFTHMLTHTHTHTHAPPPAPTPAKPSISPTPSLSPPILRAPPTDTHRPSPPKPTPHASMGIARPPGPPAIPPPAPSIPRRPTTQAVTTKPPRAPYAPRPSTMPPTQAPTPPTPRIPLSPPSRQPLCNISRPDMYLVQVGMPVGTSVAFAKAHIKDVLRREFNRSVELQVLRAPPTFIFRTVAGPLVFTAVSVINALLQSARSSASTTILSVTPISVSAPDHKHLVHSVLQFVPGHVDVRVCSFSEQVERGLLTAYTEVRRRYQENGSFTIEIVNITISMAKAQRQQQRAPVDVTFAVKDERGYLLGSEVSGHLRQLSMVEYSFYLGFPVVQIAEPFHYPELNMTHLLRSSWVKTVLLGVLDQRVSERTFQAKMERRLAQLVGEGLGVGRRWRRATTVGNSSVQVVRVVRLEGADHPLELVYFVEGGTGERLPAHTTAAMLNRINLQRAAIVLGYRVHGTILAQPVEKLALSPSETQPSSVWLVVGVVVPVLVVLFIIVILYWKLCRSEKLEFQPDAMSTITQRQKLQAPSVKGFDFAKLHLGQHSKDAIMVIQEPPQVREVVKEATPPEGGEMNTPKSKSSSTKVSRSAAGRRRGRLSPSDGDSLGSEASSGRDSGEESTRPAATPNEGKQHRRSKHSKSKLAAGGSGADEQLSSSSIFDHVDRMSRGSSDGTRRISNKIQLIAMQPVPSPPTPPHHEHAHTHTHTYTLTERGPDGTQVNTEIAVALRHKSEIEHHRNKIRLRAKRKGLYEFPSMEDIMAAFGDSAEQQRVCRQIHKILHPDTHSSYHSHTPSAESQRRSSRGRRSPRQRRGQPVIGSLDKDRLITDRDATYRKYPGVNNVAYVSDPEQLAAGSPSPDEVFPGSPPCGPAPGPPSYQPPQPTIEEARQQMLSLLDDAFALVSPSSQGSPAPLALTSVAGVTVGGMVSPGGPASPPPRPIRHWGSAPSNSPFSARYAELGMSPTSVQGLLQREALGSGYLPSDVYSSGGQYGDEPSCSHRPPPVGGSTGAQLQQLTQVGLSSRMGVYGVGRSVSGPSGCSWLQYRSDDEEPRPGSDRDNMLSYSAEYSSSPLFQMPRTALTDPSAPPTPTYSPPAPPTATYSPPAPPDGPPPAPPSQSSASLIKAIREELQRLSQKQPPVAAYHS